ncbi:MAG TPA: hypothetical protein VKS79_25140 [Gemmataceae bacterium]|nr:hypothetical protein [Gemmataceae bacterium]
MKLLATPVPLRMPWVFPAVLIANTALVVIARCEPTGGSDDPAVLTRLKHSRAVNAIVYCDGDVVITGCADGALRAWDVATGKTSKQLQVSNGKPFDELFWIARSRKEKAVFFSSQRTLQAWDMSLEKPSWQLRLDPPSCFNDLAISSSGRDLAVGNLNMDVLVLDSRNGKMKGTIKCQYAGVFVQSVQFAPDNKTVIVAYDNSHILIWSTSEARGAEDFKVGNGILNRALASPDGKLLAICFANDRAVHLWDFDKRSIVGQLIGHKGFPGGMLFMDNETLFTADTTGAVIRWDLKHSKAIRKYECDKRQAIDLAISPDLKRLAVACESGDVVIIDLTKP